MTSHDSWTIMTHGKFIFLWTIMTHGKPQNFYEQSWLMNNHDSWKPIFFVYEKAWFLGWFYGRKHDFLRRFFDRNKYFPGTIFGSEKHFSGMIPGSFWHHSGIIQGSSRHHFKFVLGDFRVIFRSKKSRSQNRRRMIGASCRSCLVLFPPSPLIKKRHFFMKYWSKKWYATGTGN